MVPSAGYGTCEVRYRRDHGIWRPSRPCLPGDGPRIERRGHVVGSASDRTLLDQRRLWEKAGIEVDFVSHKHFLEETKASFPSDRLIHIEDIRC